MKVFLSWSGEFSHKVACAMRDWLPCVIQSIKPYVSSEDIDKGARWSTDIAKELDSSTFGILCITRDNLDAPWINFEAGALSKTIDKAFVSPFLFHMKRSEVRGPLLQFQSTVYEKDDVLRLLSSINNRLPAEEQLEESQLKKTFAVWWPQLEEALNQLPIPPTTKPAKEAPETNLSAILEELLELSRSQQKILRSPEELLPPDYLNYVMRHSGARSMGARNRDLLRHAHEEMIDLERMVGAMPLETGCQMEIGKKVSKIHHLLHEVLDRSMSERERHELMHRDVLEKRTLSNK